MNTTHQSPLEFWGGVECTINRVGDRYFSQLARNGHRARLSDLARFAELGLKRLRFPILWEELVSPSLGETTWSAIDAQLERMRELGIKPIAGLVHHGSGPIETSLIDPRFPEKLAVFAARVAERYPWIDAYTPVNEPLTTARFSGLYGHWFPHGRDGFTFVRALLNQVRAVVLAMRAVRAVNPDAALIQTDDLGKTFASRSLQYQADFENERRWLTWDLLCGRVDRTHPMWSYLLWLGANESDIEWFAAHPSPPDIIGVNHYITSERYLDENLRDHPPEAHGGNGRDRYADVAAVRARLEGIAGPEVLLRECGERYSLPVAVTEAHLGCTREEQLRWLGEIWTAAKNLRADGHDVRAVTAWSLLGAYDWDSLLTRDSGSYECGVFDLRSGTPRATALAHMLRDLAHGRSFEHPLMQTPGWWRRRVRLLPSIAARHRDACPPDDVAVAVVPAERQRGDLRPILITGAGGRLAEGFVRAANLRGLRCVAFTRGELDIADARSVSAKVDALHPWAVINCAGFTDIDEAESASDECRRANIDGAENLAQTCARANIPLLTFSSDHVFNGEKEIAYTESDPTTALNNYGASKIEAEAKILHACPHALFVRPGELLAPFSEDDSLMQQLRQIANGEPIEVADDTYLSVSFLPDLVNITLDLLIDGERGIWHIANFGITTPADLLRRAADILQLDRSLVRPVPNWSLRRPAARPRMRALTSERAQFLSSLDDALLRYCRDLPALSTELEPAVGAQ